MRVARAGLLTTVQDLGRRGVQQHGIVGAGAMDVTAHRIANILVGNTPSAATIEATMIGPTLQLETDALIAVTGADLGASLDDRRLPLWTPVLAPAGSVLAFSSSRSGCRAYIAVAGGVDVPVVLGSRSTDLIACLGGLHGRALRPNDTLPVGRPGDLSDRIIERLTQSPTMARAAGRSVLPKYSAEPVIRIVTGPEHDRFTAEARARLVSDTFEVTAQSNRMGIRLKGPALPLEGPYDLISSPVATGTIQVPPSGDPIVLMTDHQTVGGYPRIANVVAVDLPLLAQAVPGSRVRFMEVSLAHAQELYIAREHDLMMLAEAVRLHYS